MRIVKVILALFIFIFFSRVAFASTVSLGSVVLNLGMDQKQVMSQLNKVFKVVQVKDTGASFIVYEKLGKHPNAVGSINFQDGSLFSVIKYWYGGTDLNAFYRAFFMLINRYSEKTSKLIRVETKTYVDVDYDGKDIYFYLPNSPIYYEVSQFTQNGVTWFQVNETLMR